MQAAYPTIEVVQSLVSPDYREKVSDDILTLSLETIIQEFEDLTGYIPFLGDTDVTEDWVVIAPPNRKLVDLGTGFWTVTSILTETESREFEYKLYPPNGLDPRQGEGFSSIQLLWPFTYETRLLVTGKKGYARQLPEDVYHAIADKAAIFATLSETEGEGALKLLKQGPVEYEWDPNSEFGKSKQRLARYKATVQKYRRRKL